LKENIYNKRNKIKCGKCGKYGKYGYKAIDYPLKNEIKIKNKSKNKANTTKKN